MKSEMHILYCFLYTAALSACTCVLINVYYSSNPLTQSSLEWQFNFLLSGIHVIHFKHHVVLGTEKLLLVIRVLVNELPRIVNTSSYRFQCYEIKVLVPIPTLTPKLLIFESLWKFWYQKLSHNYRRLYVLCSMCKICT